MDISSIKTWVDTKAEQDLALLAKLKSFHDFAFNHIKLNQDAYIHLYYDACDLQLDEYDEESEFRILMVFKIEELMDPARFKYLDEAQSTDGLDPLDRVRYRIISTVYKTFRRFIYWKETADRPLQAGTTSLCKTLYITLGPDHLEDYWF